MCLQLLEDFHMKTALESKQQQRERNNLLSNIDIVEMKDFIAKNVHILSK